MFRIIPFSRLSLMPAFLLALAGLMAAPVQGADVMATVETQPVPSTEDAADDPCIWVHPDDPARSAVIGTDKEGGLGVYALNGELIQYVPGGNPNNVDLRYGFPLGGGKADIVAASDRSTDAIVLYAVEPGTRTLRALESPIQTGITVYGLCMYRSPGSGDYYVFVNSKEGVVEQWRLDGAGGKVTGECVRRFHVGSQLEGCVADDELGYLYIGEEETAIWKYGAEPDFEQDDRVVVDIATPKGRFAPDVEGLTLYYGPNGTGYLIASSQGNNTFVVYEREGDNDYVATFRVAEGNGIDAVTETDGIDVVNVPLGPAFPKGLLVVQDDRNDTGNQNFKLVPWEHVAQAIEPPLAVHVDAGPWPRAGEPLKTR